MERLIAKTPQRMSGTWWSEIAKYVFPSCHASKEIATCHYGIACSWNDVSLSYVKHENCSINRTYHLWITYETYWPVKPSRTGDAHMRQWTVSSLVQVMHCRLFDAKPLHSLMRICFKLNPYEWTSAKFETKQIKTMVICLRNQFVGVTDSSNACDTLWAPFHISLTWILVANSALDNYQCPLSRTWFDVNPSMDK